MCRRTYLFTLEFHICYFDSVRDLNSSVYMMIIISVVLSLHWVPFLCYLEGGIKICALWNSVGNFVVIHIRADKKNSSSNSFIKNRYSSVFNFFCCFCLTYSYLMTYSMQKNVFFLVIFLSFAHSKSILFALENNGEEIKKCDAVIESQLRSVHFLCFKKKMVFCASVWFFCWYFYYASLILTKKKTFLLYKYDVRLNGNVFFKEHERRSVSTISRSKY